LPSSPIPAAASSEALALRWRDIDLVDREVSFRGQLTRATRETPAETIRRKGGAESYTTILLPALAAELTANLEAELAHGRGESDDLIACTRHGRPLSQRNVGRALTEAATTAELGHISLLGWAGNWTSTTA
jgi:integrase